MSAGCTKNNVRLSVTSGNLIQTRKYMKLLWQTAHILLSIFFFHAKTCNFSPFPETICRHCHFCAWICMNVIHSFICKRVEIFKPTDKNFIIIIHSCHCRHFNKKSLYIKHERETVFLQDVTTQSSELKQKSGAAEFFNWL